jgi:hypothetical protein
MPTARRSNGLDKSLWHVPRHNSAQHAAQGIEAPVFENESRSVAIANQIARAWGSGDLQATQKGKLSLRLPDSSHCGFSVSF